jgi:hypothetical protein
VWILFMKLIFIIFLCTLLQWNLFPSFLKGLQKINNRCMKTVAGKHFNVS